MTDRGSHSVGPSIARATDLTMASDAMPPVLRFLCFGDSLTSGHSCMGTIHHPYNMAMEDRLVATLPAIRIESEEDGADGDVVTTDLGGSFLRRIQEHCKSS